MPTITDLPLPTLPGGSSGLTGVLAVPDGEGPWPAVVMVHEVFGVDDIMRRQAERMASAGFLTLLPDLFAEGGARRCLVATFRAIADGEGRAFRDVESARRVLTERPDCTGRVGIIGFFMGGGFALVAAQNRGFDAASVNYGRLPAALDARLMGACPVVGSYGGADRSLTGAAAKLEASLTRLGVPHDVKEYPEAGHSFLNDAQPDLPRPVRLLVERVLHVGPDPAAAADAWRRIDGFLHAHLA